MQRRSPSGLKDLPKQHIWLLLLLHSDIGKQSSHSSSEFGGPRVNNEVADLIVHGALLETKLFIYGKIGEGMHETLDETLILVLLAGGGKVMLQLAESGTFFGQVDFFEVCGKFALTDAYENHFLLPKGKIIVVTHRRVLMLQQPLSIMAQRKFNPARDRCSVMWDVLWDNLVKMEITHGKKDQPGSSPSQLILYVQNRPMESKESTRVIKCIHESPQAFEIYSSIEQAMIAYGPKH